MHPGHMLSKTTGRGAASRFPASGAEQSGRTPVSAFGRWPGMGQDRNRGKGPELGSAGAVAGCGQQLGGNAGGAGKPTIPHTAPAEN